MPNAYAKPIAALKRAVALRFRDRALRGKLPKDGGIYAVLRVTGPTSSLLYIGKAKDLQQRLYHNLLHGQFRSHTLSRKLLKAMKLGSKKSVERFLVKECAVRWVVEKDAKERSYLEHFAIAHFRSPLND